MYTWDKVLNLTRLVFRLLCNKYAFQIIPPKRQGMIKTYVQKISPVCLQDAGCEGKGRRLQDREKKKKNQNRAPINERNRRQQRKDHMKEKGKKKNGK